MTLHYNIATEGIRAGHKILAKLGFGYTVEVIIEPIPDTGGGYGPSWIPDTNEYLITIRITKGIKVWEKKYDADLFHAKTLERILVSFKRITSIVEHVTFSIKSKSINNKNIIVEAFTR